MDMINLSAPQRFSTTMFPYNRILIDLGVVGLTQRSNVDQPIRNLNLELCVLSADSLKVVH